MSSLKVIVPVLIALSLIVAPGCSSTNRSDQSTASDQAATQPSQTADQSSQTTAQTTGQNSLSTTDQQFVTKAAQGGLAEVQLGQLASQKASSSAVKQFGQRMVTDHTQVYTVASSERKHALISFRADHNHHI